MFGLYDGKASAVPNEPFTALTAPLVLPTIALESSSRSPATDSGQLTELPPPLPLEPDGTQKAYVC